MGEIEDRSTDFLKQKIQAIMFQQSDFAGMKRGLKVKYGGVHYNEKKINPTAENIFETGQQLC